MVIIDDMTTAEDFNRLQAEAADRRHRQIVEAFLSGKTQYVIAKETGVSRSRIQRILRRARERGLLNIQR